MRRDISLRSLPGVPEVRPGDDLAALIVAALEGKPPDPGSVIAIAHTVVSKEEGAIVELAGIRPSDRAVTLAAEADRDPRVVEVVLAESLELLRAERGVLISRTRNGFVCANAGVDASNAPAPDTVLLLPRDPDGSARRIRARIAQLLGAAAGPVPPAVMITDTFGRPWRQGQTDVAIGLAGLQPLDDWRGRNDAAGVSLSATVLAVADAAAGAADLARAKDSGEPVVVIEGLSRFVTGSDGPGAAALVRPLAEDLFRS